MVPAPIHGPFTLQSSGGYFGSYGPLYVPSNPTLGHKPGSRNPCFRTVRASRNSERLIHLEVNTSLVLITLLLLFLNFRF